MSGIAPGVVINNRYALERQIGAGGMATVWLADDRLLGRKVAVKILSDRYASDPGFVERFRREASAAASLSHQNIVAVYDRGEAAGSEEGGLTRWRCGQRRLSARRGGMSRGCGREAGASRR